MWLSRRFLKDSTESADMTFSGSGMLVSFVDYRLTEKFLPTGLAVIQRIIYATDVMLGNRGAKGIADSVHDHKCTVQTVP